MDLEKFKNSPSGKLVSVNVEGLTHAAFVPHPLPPKFHIDNKMGKLLSEASHNLGLLKSLGETVSNPHLLIEPFIRREAVLSSKIEGTETELTELYAFEAGQLIFPGMQRKVSESDARVVMKNVRAFEYGVERIKSLPLSLRLIKELHQHLMQGDQGQESRPGEFRQVQNWIGHRECKITESRFVPPPVTQMHDALDAFEKHLHTDDLPPLIHLAMTHYQFEAIHPFRDGNGRVGRLLTSLMLVERKLLSLPLLYLSVYLEKHRSQYYDLLLAVSRDGEWYEWCMFFLEGVVQQSREASSSFQRLRDLQQEWRQRLTKARASSLVPRLADALFKTPILSIPQAQNILTVKSYPSAKLSVDKLVEAGILKPVDESKYGKVYFAPEIFEIITGSAPQHDAK